MGVLKREDDGEPDSDSSEGASLLHRTPGPLAVEPGPSSQTGAPSWAGGFMQKTVRRATEALGAVKHGSIVNSKVATVVLASCALLAGIYLLASAAQSATESEGDIRVALLADAHLIGPQYVCCTESNDVDNESIMKTVERLKAAQRQIEALSPPPAAVVFLGDVIHNGYHSHDFEWYLANRNAYTVGGEIFSNFSVPVRYLWGNHDYHTTCGSAADSYDRTGLSHRLFRHFLGPAALPYSAIQLGRYKLIFLNAMLGPSWDPTHPRCDTKYASLGAEQLLWLERQLSGGGGGGGSGGGSGGQTAAFVFMHHPLPVALRNEAPELKHPDVLSVLLAHSDAVMAVFSGHYHRGLDWRNAYPFPVLTLPACRYDSDNWFLMNLPREGPLRSWRLLDWEKNKGGARCSDTWVYPAAGLGQGPAVAAVGEVAGGEFAGGAGGVGGANAGPAGFAASAPHPMDPQPQETGSCGTPRLEEVGTYELEAVQAVDDVPGPTGHQFNPEPPCCLTFQRAFLERCLQEGPTAACCGILGEHLRPSSAAYGASCMCWPPFWSQAQDAFREAGHNASAVLERCAREHGKALQWPGRVGGSCLLPGSRELPPVA
ncbi:hypothetical protein CHLRE_16g657450v5 [Chlamydomonas reinhardtii]|uniref:Calcineurin-like phosphoesterase domain-containing protein n=1 Tax=Chlamydomonas reinhardtii TaxID=3055 RepID=A0A2K3CTA5_CHLRE|nr:uncharacterized protein CHLRE_16g657450v5 [Chlamydomonas reinhardtii]PNW71513.1 hypothetical protein CHLRE_16g657450v5 [Chlamydomonas reinhardtii]